MRNINLNKVNYLLTFLRPRNDLRTHFRPSSFFGVIHWFFEIYFQKFPNFAFFSENPNSGRRMMVINQKMEWASPQKIFQHSKKPSTNQFVTKKISQMLTGTKWPRLNLDYIPRHPGNFINSADTFIRVFYKINWLNWPRWPPYI